MRHCVAIDRAAASLNAPGVPADKQVLRACSPHRYTSSAPVAAGIVNTLSDVGFFVADAKGYFTAEGLDVKLTTFRSSGNMISPLMSP